MSITITITGNTPAEVLSELAVLASGVAQESQPEKQTRSGRPSRTASTNQNQTAQESLDSKPAEAKAAETDAKSDDKQEATEAIAPETVKDKANAWIKAAADASERDARKVKVKGLLSKYKASALTTVPAEQRAAFLADLEALDSETAEELD